MPPKSISTSSQVLVAPKSWSYYTTGVSVNKNCFRGLLSSVCKSRNMGPSFKCGSTFFVDLSFIIISGKSVGFWRFFLVLEFCHATLTFEHKRSIRQAKYGRKRKKDLKLGVSIAQC